jgi:hypothetical protein
MDETLRELASRLADGDLDDTEASQLETRAETDPELAAEIDSTKELRSAVRAIANRMEPPAALDRVMEPLRQAPPVPAQRVRPVYRWLGIAAAMVLGVTVALEMARRNPSPTLTHPVPQRDLSVQKPDEIFKLAPLPTAVPHDNRPLGAADHLLEEEPALPPAPEPAPLEVMGPLNTEAPSMATGGLSLSPEDRSAVKNEELETQITAQRDQDQAMKERPRRTEKRSAENESEATFERNRAQPASDREAKEGTSAGGLSQPSAAGKPKSAAVSVVLLIDEKVVWSGLSLSCPATRRSVRIEVRENLVFAVESVVGADDPVTNSCLPDGFIGSSLHGVGDGIFLAEFVVGDSPK